MKSKTRKCAPLCILIVTVAMSVIGCSRGFYLSESEVNAYRENLRSAAVASNALAPLQGKRVEIHFDSSGPTPHISRTNLLDVLRSTQLVILEQLFHQIHLERLSTQIEQELDRWIQDRLQVLQQGESGVRLKSLDLVTMTFLTAPTFSYDAAGQSIAIDVRVKLVVSGAINVNVASGVGGFIATLFGSNPNGDYRLSLQMDDYHVPIQFTLSQPFADAGRISMHLAPQPGAVTVTGNAPDDVRNGIKQVLTTRLSGVVDESRSLAYDNFSLTGLSLVNRQASGSTNTEAQLLSTYLARPHRAPPILDVVVRGQYQRLYHARKQSGVWSDFAIVPIPGFVNSDPALVASDDDKLELAAVSDHGLLLHVAWRDGRWGVEDYGSLAVDPSSPNKQFAQARPAIVATAPGQVEVFAVATDGALYHARRISGAWNPVEKVNGALVSAQAPLRDPVAVVGGNQVAVFYVDARNRLFSAVYSTASQQWGNGEEITTQGVQFAPAAASCGDGRIDLVHIGQNQAMFHLVLNFSSDRLSLGHGSETSLGRAFNAGPALTCSGYQQLELVARGQDNHIQHNHLVAVTGPQGPVDGRTVRPGWQGWNDASDRFFGTILFGQLDSPLALASTRTGDVELLARASGASPKNLFETTYDSSRYAVSAWKAVHWRGFQQVGSAGFLGAPSLAVSDQQLELGVVGVQGKLWNSTFADDNMARFSSFPGSTVQFIDASGNTFLVDPVVVSSGPGCVEFFYKSQGGGIQDIRMLNGFPVPSELPGSNAVRSVFAVVAYGNGQIELVGVAADHSIMHWRRVNGAWQDPVTISTFALSAPVLAYVGDGQLDMLAVGGDQRLRRWRFVNDGWTNEYRVPSDFNVSAVAFGPSAASSWGDGTLDLVVVEAQTGKMFHARTQPARVNGDINLVFNQVGGKTIDTPTLVALEPYRVGIFAAGTDNFFYENWSRSDSSRSWTLHDIEVARNLVWPGFRPLTSAQVLSGNAAKLSSSGLAILATESSTGRVFYNRLVHGVWSGFTPIAAQPQEIQQRPSFRPVVAVH